MSGKKNKFSSMAEMATKFREFHRGVTALPLMDDSPADVWMSCGTELSRKTQAQAWLTDREKYEEPMDVRDFKVLLAYEANGAKMEAAFGWSALGLWLTGLRQHTNAKSEDEMRAKLEYASKMDVLLETGASIDAFQAAYPNALSAIILHCHGQEDNGWELVETLLKKGWNPNEWNPLSQDGNSGSMHSMFEAAGRNAIGEGVELAARWQSVALTAQKQGFDLNSRNRKGLTILGASLNSRGYGSSKDAWDPRVEGLINAGADHTMASRFWLSAMEEDPFAQQAMASRMEAAQIKKASIKAQAASQEPEGLASAPSLRAHGSRL